MRRRLGPEPLEPITAGRFLAPALDRLFVLVSSGTGNDAVAMLRATVTVRPADGHMWWIYWGSARNDASRVVLSYHGGCYPDSTDLCTGGADWLDVSGATFLRCEAPATRSGCLAEAHGMIEPYGVGWIASTGGESLVQCGQHGSVLRRLQVRGLLPSGARSSSLRTCSRSS